jgi:SP family sugar porter-like MFS transporter
MTAGTFGAGNRSSESPCQLVKDETMFRPAEITPHFRMGFLWAICLVAAMGGLLFGYDWVVIGGAKPFYELYFDIADRPFMQGLAMSAALFGCLIGAAASGMLTDRYGRKWLLVLSAFLFTASSIGTALSPEFVTFNIARLVGGIGIGLASNLSPMYIAEISPAQMRGRFVSINQLTVVIGILAAQIVNWLIARDVPADATRAVLAGSWYADTGWRWMFSACAIPASAFFLMMFFVPESPRWLAKAGRFDAAENILRKVGGEQYARSEIDNIRETLGSEEIGQVHFRDLFAPDVSRILVLGIGLAVLQQWCGINVIFNYAQEVFAAAGYSISGIMQSIVITGIVNLVFTFVAIFTVDRVGRRPLMLFGAAGLALIYVVLGAAYYTQSRGIHMVVLIVAAIGCYAMSLAPVTWVVISEIFPNRIRGVAVSVTVLALWTACTVLTFTFPYLNLFLGAHGTFWLYATICMTGFIFVWRRLPETKDKSLEQIEAELTA